MIEYPIRLLLLGYLCAAIAAIGAAWAGMGLLVAALVFWIGGAIAVLVLAATHIWRRRAGMLRVEEDEASYRAALEQWERDRLDDSAEATAAAKSA